MFREGCRAAAPGCGGGAGPCSAQAPPDAPLRGPSHLNGDPGATTPLGRRVLPTATPSLSHLKRWQGVVCYIPEGRLLTAGEGQLESRAERLGRGLGRPLGSEKGEGAGVGGAPADPECSRGSSDQLRATLLFGVARKAHTIVHI